MSTKSRPTRATRRFATALSVAAAAAVTMASPALAENSAGQHLIDRDSVAIGDSAASFGDGTLGAQRWSRPGLLTWYYDSTAKRVRAELIGRLFVSQAGCGFVQATFTYGDGSTSTAQSFTTCDRATRAIDLDSLASKDAVRATIVVKAGGQFAAETAFGTLGSAGFHVEDAEHSDGTCAKLDLDSLNAANASATLFSGTAQYFCSGETLRVRLRGTLRWNDTMAGDRARLEVKWIFSGNALSTSPTLSGLVSQSTPQRAIDLTSQSASDVIGVCIKVTSAANSSTTFTQQAAQCQKLGHIPPGS
jgi:hypothetical protein